MMACLEPLLSRGRNKSLPTSQALMTSNQNPEECPHSGYILVLLARLCCKQKKGVHLVGATTYTPHIYRYNRLTAKEGISSSVQLTLVPCGDCFMHVHCALRLAEQLAALGWPWWLAQYLPFAALHP